MPDLTQLRIFLAVAEHKNFTRAASQLHYSQQTVSKSIAALEAQLGVRLLDRTTREVVLTPAGRTLVELGVPAVDAVDAALRRTAAVGQGLAGLIRVGVTPGVGIALQPRIAAAVTADIDDIQILIQEDRFAESVDRLRRGTIDLVVTRTGRVPPDLHKADLAPTPAVVIVPVGHMLFGRARVSVHELDGLQLQLWNPADHPYSAEVISGLADAGAHVRVVVADVVGGGGPPTITPGSFVVRPTGWPTDHDQTTLHLDDPGLTLPLRLVWTSDAVGAVVDRVLQRLG